MGTGSITQISWKGKKINMVTIYQVSKITDLRDNSDRRYCEKIQFNIRGLRAPEAVPYLALLPSRKGIPGFRISGS